MGRDKTKAFDFKICIQIMLFKHKDYLRKELYLFWDIWNIEAIGNYGSSPLSYG